MPDFDQGLVGSATEGAQACALAKEVAWDAGFRTEANALGPAAFEAIEVAPNLSLDKPRGLESGNDEFRGFDPVVAAFEVRVRRSAASWRNWARPVGRLGHWGRGGSLRHREPAPVD